MSKIGIVIQREYFNRVKKKSFILLTILMPLIFIGLVGGTLFLSTIKDTTARVIMVVDSTGKYIHVLKDTEQFQFVIANDDHVDFRSQSNQSVYATLVITKDLLEDPSALTLYSQKQVTPDTEKAITRQLDDFLRDEKIESYQIPDLKRIMAESKISVQMKTVKWDESGNEKASSTEIASLIGMLFTFVIFIFIFTCGGMVMQGVLEEKTNRIVELMVSSVKPFELMMGKIIGIGLVVLTQFLLWAILFGMISVSASFIFALFVSPEIISTAAATASVPPVDISQKIFELLGSVNLLEISLYFIIFFIGGYLLYASIFAAVGAMVNNQEDTQQFMMPIMILAFFAFYTGFYSMQNPDGPLAYWTSLFPLSSPIVMMIRLPFDIPWWQKIVSIGLLYLTAILMIKLTGKIYRIGILMYGKKPNLKELIRWLKY